MSVEFSIINQYFNLYSAKAYKGIGDDAALIKKDSNSFWAISIDTLNENTHFLPSTSPFNLGWKALTVNISDIHAMGGIPKFALISIALPKIKTSWIKEFSKGLFSCAKKYDVNVIGGDTTKGPLSISICILGEVLKKNILLRSNVKKTDDIWVTGEIGLAALGLRSLQNEIKLPKNLMRKSIQALEKPTLHKSMIKKIAKLSHSAIDISDGLIDDLKHILDASKMGANIYLDALPINPWIRKNKLVEIALNGGDDYQLLFTASQKNRNKINFLNRKSSLKITRIGSVKKDKRLDIIDNDGGFYKIKKGGFNHFEP